MVKVPGKPSSMVVSPAISGLYGTALTVYCKSPENVCVPVSSPGTERVYEITKSAVTLPKSHVMTPVVGFQEVRKGSDAVSVQPTGTFSVTVKIVAVVGSSTSMVSVTSTLPPGRYVSGKSRVAVTGWAEALAAASTMRRTTKRAVSERLISHAPFSLWPSMKILRVYVIY
jgi:hypothetical protein